MANVESGTFSYWDTVIGATRAGKAHVLAITFSAGATGGLTTLQSDGATWISYTVAANADNVQPVVFPEPVLVEALTMSAVGTNVTVHVYWA